MEELVEEILLRLPLQEPTSLVCKPWRRLVSSPGFRRRFLEFHRAPPMLGFIRNHMHNDPSFVCTTASSPLHGNLYSPLHGHSNISDQWRALDARHGRVLLQDLTTITVLVVWDPIMDEQQELPVLPRETLSCSAAVLCAAATTGSCSHHGCHRGPFRVVFVGTEPRSMFVCTYSSDVAAWSEPISIHLEHYKNFDINDEIYYYTFGRYSPSVLLGNQPYFGIPLTNAALKYDLILNVKSWIQLPSLRYNLLSSVLTTTDDGALGLVSLQSCILRIWLRMDTPDEANAPWTQFKVIDLRTQLLDVHPFAIPGAKVVGFADGLGIVFVAINDALYTVDLKTYMVKKVYHVIEMGTTVFPYMRFYSPAWEAASLGEEPSAAGSSA